MQVKWYGHAAFRLTDANGLRLITDPYTPEGVGYPPIRDPAHLVVISSDDDDAHCRADLIAGDPAVANALEIALNGGARSVAGVDITAIAAAEWDEHPEHAPGQNGMYRFTLDGIKCAHMGDVGNPLTDAQIGFFEDVDVLFALAGGYLTIELPDLMTMIRAAKPKLIIPMHFRTLTYRPRNTMWIESFLSHFDDAQVDFACAHAVDIGRAEIPNDTRVLVMDYAR
ncbi:MAG: MBL fold metallo-hydrolase [Pseudomonadota bacterium]